MGLRRFMLDEGASREQREQVETEEEALARQQRELSQQLSEAVEAYHRGFHQDWGQLFKAGHQNSRWAQQVQEYACLYTSHATNFLFRNTWFRPLEDLMPHDRATLNLGD